MKYLLCCIFLITSCCSYTPKNPSTSNPKPTILKFSQDFSKNRPIKYSRNYFLADNTNEDHQGYKIFLERIYNNHLEQIIYSFLPTDESIHEKISYLKFNDKKKSIKMTKEEITHFTEQLLKQMESDHKLKNSLSEQNPKSNFLIILELEN